MKPAQLKKNFVVYSHYMVLQESIVKAYSKAEAEHIMLSRLQGHGHWKPRIDKVLSTEEELKLMTDRQSVQYG